MIDTRPRPLPDHFAVCKSCSSILWKTLTIFPRDGTGPLCARCHIERDPESLAPFDVGTEITAPLEASAPLGDEKPISWIWHTFVIVAIWIGGWFACR